MIEPAHSLKELIFSKQACIDERLIITPILNYKSQVKEGSASIDLRLGCSFRIPKKSQLTHFDPLNPNYARDQERFKDVIYVGIGDHLVLHPRQFVLGSTLEYIHLPSYLAAYVVGRSSWGRDGLVIATATGVHPRFSGVLTLELTNLGEIPLKLYPGITIAQLFIHRVNSPHAGKGYLSAFMASTKPESGKPISDEDILKIKRFKESRT
jgi:dCTP deaminase